MDSEDWAGQGKKDRKKEGSWRMNNFKKRKREEKLESGLSVEIEGVENICMKRRKTSYELSVETEDILEECGPYGLSNVKENSQLKDVMEKLGCAKN